MAKAPTLPPTKRSSALEKPSVHGLDASRHVADRRRRNKRIKDRIVSTIIAIVAIAFVALGAWVGWTIYEDQQAEDELERQRVQAELGNDQGSGGDLPEVERPGQPGVRRRRRPGPVRHPLTFSIAGHRERLDGR